MNVDEKATIEAAEAAKKESEKQGKTADLVGAAMKAYGIAKQFVLSARMDGEEAVIVTAGGTKIRFKAGDKVEPLGPEQLMGGTPKKGKPLTGDKKK